MNSDRYFLYYFLGFGLLFSLGYVINFIITKDKRKERNKKINDYLEYLKIVNPNYYNQVKNPNYRDKNFYLGVEFHKVFKGVNPKVSEYAKKNNLRNIPFKEVKKIMRKNGIKY